MTIAPFVAEAARVGPHGYEHGWIKVDGPLYHGTSAKLARGDKVHPNYGWAHATTSKFVAASYARLRGGGHVYEVEQTGPVEKDTHVSGIGATSSYRSQHHFRVVRKLDESPDDIYFGTLSRSRPHAALRTADTAEASTVHEPFGSPSGPGLWHHKGMQLPAYIQHVAHHLVAQGHDESRAIEMAVGIVRNWAEGHDGHGHAVHPDVQAAAARNIAEWEADKARGSKARRSAVTTTQRAAMATASINDLPDDDFAYIEPGGTKDASGKTVPRSLRHFPVHDADHVRNALSRAPQSPFGDKAMPKIRARAKKFGIDAGGGDSGSASRASGELMRDYPLEDMHIVRSGEGGDGRTVEAFAAVFNQETEIMDPQGHYLEVISPAAFNKRLSDLRRSRGGFGSVKVIFNHGRSPDGTPVERFMMPCAKPLSIEATDRGLLTRSRYFDTPLGNEVLQLISEGGITAQSFIGKIVRSDPEPGRYGRYRPDSSGRLTTVHRHELGLREYGGVLFPAYEGAEVLGVRMSAPGTWEPDEFDPALLPDGEAAAGEPLTPDGAEHSARYHQHALYALRSQELREKAGLVW